MPSFGNFTQPSIPFFSHSFIKEMIMKNLLVLLSLSLTLTAMGQTADSWKVCWNKKVLLKTGKEDETANTKKINAADLNKKYSLEISYKESSDKDLKDWKRSILFFNESDNPLRKDSTRSVKLSAAELKTLFGDKKKIKIYTVAIPSDPNRAAQVRVRRVHLCTLELQ